MKRNAILVASILFVAAGCAHQGSSGRAGYDRGSEKSSNTGSMSFNTETPDRNPDGSIRTPGNDPASYSEVDASFNHQVDSELVAEGSTLDSFSATEPGGIPDDDMYADSSVRGGTIKAEGIEPYSSSRTSNLDEDRSESYSVDVLQPDENLTAESFNRDDFGQGSSATWQSDKASGSVRGSANWNSSDDLLRDGPFADSPEMNNDASVGGAASSETGRGSSSDSNLSVDLNSSTQMEENISGDFNVRGNTEPKPQVGVTGNEPEHLFQNNRAQGIGSAATGEYGIAHSRDPLSESKMPLVERVKAQLTQSGDEIRNTTAYDAGRNVQVSERNGEITLRGTVPSERDRDLLEIRAMEVSGVKKVHNHLTVTSQADPANRDLGLGHDLEDRIDELQPE